MGFSTNMVSKIIGLTIRQVDYWDKIHFIKPSIRESTGRGSIKLYSFKDLVQFKVGKNLMGKGVSLQKLRKSMQYLKKNMPDIETPLAELRFFTDGDTIFVLTEDERVMLDTLKSGQYVLSIALGEIAENLISEVKEMQQPKEYKVTVNKKMYKVLLSTDTEDGGYNVDCPELPGCVSQGDTVEEALFMIEDAIKGHLEILKQDEGLKVSSA